MVRFLSNRQNGREVDGKDSFPEDGLVPVPEQKLSGENHEGAAGFDETPIPVWVMP